MRLPLVECEDGRRAVPCFAQGLVIAVHDVHDIWEAHPRRGYIVMELLRNELHLRDDDEDDVMCNQGKARRAAAQGAWLHSDGLPGV